MAMFPYKTVDSNYDGFFRRLKLFSTPDDIVEYSYLDNENYLAFTPENNTTFYSSQDNLGKPIEHINWTFIGGYEIYDVKGYEDLKILTLNYENGDIEEFELSVINDQRIELYNIVSETTYEFSGRGFVQYLKGGKSKKEAKSLKGNTGRKRTKISRNIKNRRKLK